LILNKKRGVTMKYGNFEIDLNSGKRVFIATMIFALLAYAMSLPNMDQMVVGSILTMATAITTFYYATHDTKIEE